MIELNPLNLQRMSRTDQALCLMHVVSLRSAASLVTTAEVRDFGAALALPPSANLSADIGRLVAKGFVVKRDRGWAIAPLGRRYLASEFLASAAGAFVDTAHQPMGAELQGVVHSPVPPEFAPARVLDGVRNLLDRSPWAQNVMLVSRFDRGREDDPIAGTIETIRMAVAQHGMNLLLANEQRAEDRLGLNVVAHLWASMYAIGLFEDRVGEGLNPNLVFEIGALVATGRRVLIARDHTSPDVPSDITDHIYSKVDFDQHDQVDALVHSWIRDDLRLGACASCPQAGAGVAA